MVGSRFRLEYYDREFLMRDNGEPGINLTKIFFATICFPNDHSRKLYNERMLAVSVFSGMGVAGKT